MISLLSSTASIPKKTSKPTVRLRKKLYVFLVSLLINGYHRRPIIIGTIPTYAPIIANSKTCSTFGLGTCAAASTLLLNLVPSDVVIPTSYGSPGFQENGIITCTSVSLGNVLVGSIAAG